jgi:hypothetical protein
MARVAVAAAAAAVVGYFSGNPQLALTTFAVVYGSTAPNQKATGPRLDDLKAPQASYGATLVYLEGSARLPGCIAWASEKREISTTTEEGGKGGGGTDVTTYTYEIDILYRLTCNPVAGVVKVFDNGKLIWTIDIASDTQSVADSYATTKWRALRFYTGAADQLPDPVYEAAVGVGEAPAFRGGGSVFIEGLQLGSGGQIPILTFEVSSAGHYSSSGVGFKFTKEAVLLPDVVRRLCERTGQLDADDIDVTQLTETVFTRDAFWRYKIVLTSDTTDYSGADVDDSAWAIGQGPFGDTLPSTITDWPMPVTLVAKERIIWLRRDISFTRLGQVVVRGAFDDTADVWFNGQPVPVDIDGSLVKFVGSFTPDRLEGVLAYRVKDTASGEANHIYAGIEATRVDIVRGMPVTSVSPTRQVLANLQTAYFFDSNEAGKLAFVSRGGLPVAVIPYDDLGASESDSIVEPLPKLLRNDIETPALISVRYSNFSDDYQDGTESGDRLVTESTSVQTVDLPLVMVPADAKRIADVITASFEAGAMAIGPLALTSKYARLQPSDVVSAIDGDGTSYRLRLTKKTEAAQMITLECEIDDPFVLSSGGVTDTSGSPSNTVRAAADTQLLLLDIPILRDADDVPGFYAAFSAEGKWPGASFRRSVDGVVFDEVFRVTDRGALGVTTTALGDWAGGNMFDETSTVVIDIGDQQTASFTRDQLLANHATGAYLIGDEIIQARDATLTAPGIYRLRGLLRGRRGTEQFMTSHEVGERAVVLKPAGIRKVEHQVSDIGLTRTYKAVTLGKLLSSADSEAFIDTGVALRPFSPVDLRAEREDGTGDITFTWERRTRLSTRFVGAAGISAPLGEAAELYAMEIWDGGYTTLKRTLTGLSAPTAVYGAAQQVEDFGSLQASVAVRVFQLSAAVGRGFPLQAAA